MRFKFQRHQKITVLVSNPKRGEGHARFSAYKDDMTVGEYQAILVFMHENGYWRKFGQPASGAMGEICWDVRHGFIQVV